MTLFKIFILHAEIRCNSHHYTLALVTRPHFSVHNAMKTYRGAENSLARPTSRCILFDG